MSAKVRKRKRELDGSLLGKANANPILDTRTYEVEFADGQTAELTENIIAQTMYAQCDSKGYQYLLLAGILDHQKDSSAVERPDMFVIRGLNQHYRKTTKVRNFVSNGKMAVPLGRSCPTNPTPSKSRTTLLPTASKTSLPSLGGYPSRSNAGIEL
jgi:hypothetical protein